MDYVTNLARKYATAIAAIAPTTPRANMRKSRQVMRRALDGATGVSGTSWTSGSMAVGGGAWGAAALAADVMATCACDLPDFFLFLRRASIIFFAVARAAAFAAARATALALPSLSAAFGTAAVGLPAL